MITLTNYKLETAVMRTTGGVSSEIYCIYSITIRFCKWGTFEVVMKDRWKTK